MDMTLSAEDLTFRDEVRNFLDTEFEGGRHQRRVAKLSQIGEK